MEINKHSFREDFLMGYLPEWNCPQCKRGYLLTPENGIKIYEYASSLELHNRDDWEPDWIKGYFMGILKCNNKKCNGVNVISGDMFVDREFIDIGEEPYHHPVMANLISPRYFNPPIEIFHIPKYIPQIVADMLKETYKLFWIDNSACANKLRILVEVIMTDQGIPKSRNIKGKPIPYLLHDRIVLFKEKNDEAAELLLAIKWIGNEGSHELNILEREDILDVYEMLQECFDKIYNPKSDKILKKAKEINENKGIRKKN